jgi:4-alpha-glucanotransferase
VTLKRVKFCFGVHNHQPVGNFGWVIEEAYKKSYFPFLELLEKYPGIRISLHFTGILYDWMKEFHPEGIALVRRLVERNQIELLTGGHFEPILPAIPDRDKVGQIEMLSKFIRLQFGVTPEGMWLAERVWEPTLPRQLAEAGVKYTILDDIHFRYSGLQESQLHGYYMTEDTGRTVALFPISKQLRYAIPFADPETTVEYLRGLANEDGNNVGIYADDGEKFGVWPKTYEHCFENGWLERFFKLISNNLDWIEMKHFGEVLHENEPLGRIYLPTASYSEMNEWAMPAEAIDRYDTFIKLLKRADLFEDNVAFVKGGFWRNFLAKYPETNQLHKRMLYVSEMLENKKGDLSETDYRQAQRLLYAGQCNCPYWHGVFGGLYLPHLRGALFQEIIAAEKTITAGLLKDQTVSGIEIFDFDADGSNEIVVTTLAQKAIVAPALGGMITELDDFAVCKNLVDIVGRRREGYHKKLLSRHEQAEGETKSIHDLVLVKEEGLDKLLVEDPYLRGMFIDHFLADGMTLDDFVEARLPEAGDFVGKPYKAAQRSSGNHFEVKLSRSGSVSANGSALSVSVTKALRFDAKTGTLTAQYQLTNDSRQPLETRFGVELDFGSYTFPLRESSIATASGETIESSRPIELDEVSGFRLDSRLYRYRAAAGFDKKAQVWTHPLWTVSLSEGGFEKVYQGAIVMPLWQVSLAAGQSWRVEITLSFAQLTDKEISHSLRQASKQVPT